MEIPTSGLLYEGGGMAWVQHHSMGEVLERLGQLRFLQGSLRKRLREKILVTNHLSLVYHFSVSAKERMPANLELEIVKGYGAYGATQYAEDALGITSRKYANLFRSYCLWKHDLLLPLDNVLKDLREMDKEYAYLYPDSKVK